MAQQMAKGYFLIDDSRIELPCSLNFHIESAKLKEELGELADQF